VASLPSQQNSNNYLLSMEKHVDCINLTLVVSSSCIESCKSRIKPRSNRSHHISRHTTSKHQPPHHIIAPKSIRQIVHMVQFRTPNLPHQMTRRRRHPHVIIRHFERISKSTIVSGHHPSAPYCASQCCEDWFRVGEGGGL